MSYYDALESIGPSRDVSARYRRPGNGKSVNNYGILSAFGKLVKQASLFHFSLYPRGWAFFCVASFLDPGRSLHRVGPVRSIISLIVFLLNRKAVTRF